MMMNTPVENCSIFPESEYTSSHFKSIVAVKLLHYHGLPAYDHNSVIILYSFVYIAFVSSL